MAGAQRIAVIGAGLMGHGIALTFAQAGHDVTVYDPVPEALQTLHARVKQSLVLLGRKESGHDDIIDRIIPQASVKAAVSSSAFVIEAAPEKLELKQALFAEIEASVPATAILASNTSVIPISNIVQELSGKHRALGTHWWNPPHQIPLVEVIKTEWTDPKNRPSDV